MPFVWLLTLVSGCVSLLPSMVFAEDPLGALERLVSESRVEREITLGDLGFDRPEVLASDDQGRELFFPVPAGLTLTDATLHFDAEYLRGDGGRTTLVLSVDTYPVSARAFTADQGDAGVELGIDGSPRASGFINLSVLWSSIIAATLCEDQRSIGNSLAILPSTRLIFSFDSADIKDLSTAWTALPPRPRILLAPTPVGASSYDAAWRLGLALSRTGKTAVFKTLPLIGEEVTLDGVKVPTPWLVVPAFAALSQGGSHRLGNPAELGALLTLMPEMLRADLLIADESLLRAIADALAALLHETRVHLPKLSVELARWQARAFPFALAAPEPETLALSRLGGQTVIMMGSAAGAQAAELFSETWRRSLSVHAIHVGRVEQVTNRADQVRFHDLGAASGALDVAARADWTLSFDLSQVSTDGRLPVEARIEVAAAPGPSLTKPVASVYLNDYLLGARRLDAHGRSETIRAPIPLYALSPRNLLRVSFQRQPVSDLCREEVQSYPAAVLPSSRMRFGRPGTAESFIGLLPSFSEQTNLIVPSSYLDRATNSLPWVIRLAEAVGLSPARTRLEVVQHGDAPLPPEAAFLAFDVELQHARPRARLEGDRLTLTRSAGSPPYFDVAGLDHIALVHVLRAGAARGLLFQTIGQALPVPGPPFLLTRGDIAILGAQGALTLIDSTLSKGGITKALNQTLTHGQPLSFQGDDANWVYTAVLIIALFGLLVFAAHLMRKRARRQPPNQ